MRVAINGFGRIGRQVFKAGFHEPGFSVVAINDLVDIETLAYLLKYDSVYGIWDEPVRVQGNTLIVGRKKIQVYAEKDPSKLPWEVLQIDTVVESTGVFKTTESASLHIQAGAKRVVITAPAKDDTETVVIGANEHRMKFLSHGVLSNASCTTNATAPLFTALEPLGVQKAMLSTIHSYTASQSMVDSPQKDLRRGRAGAINIIPTSTGAAEATAKTLPALKGKFDGIAIRVPVVTGSLIDLTILTKAKTTVEEVNDLLVLASKSKRLQGVLTTTTAPIVSTDIIGDPHSAIADLSMTRVVGGNLVKVVAWYDNEWGYSNRIVDLTLS